MAAVLWRGHPRLADQWLRHLPHQARTSASRPPKLAKAELMLSFTSIPHSPLMRCLTRRIADGRLLHVIKSWLTVPVMEIIDGRAVQTTEARRTKQGVPQGGVISPLAANLYFRRFLLAWHGQAHGHRDQLDAHVVNYAGDFVICCRPGNAEAALER